MGWRKVVAGSVGRRVRDSGVVVAGGAWRVVLAGGAWRVVVAGACVGRCVRGTVGRMVAGRGGLRQRQHDAGQACAKASPTLPPVVGSLKSSVHVCGSISWMTVQAVSSLMNADISERRLESSMQGSGVSACLQLDGSVHVRV